MERNYKYINAVAAEMVKDMHWYPLQNDREKNSVVLGKKEGEMLKLVILGTEGGSYDYAGHLFRSVESYMEKVGCTHSKIININIIEEIPGYCRVYPTDGPIEIMYVAVNLNEGSVQGEVPEEHLRHVLEKYLDRDRLERHRLVDITAAGRGETKPGCLFTRIILLVNFVLWGLMTMSGGSTDTEVLIKFGAMYGPLLAQGQYWRLITPIFLHVGVMHLAFNSYALYQLGSVAETVYGGKRFLMVYFVAGATGSVFSFLFTRSVSAGASGAIFGLLGALVYFGRKEPGFFRRGFTGNLIAIIMINLFIGFTYPGIDNFAHIGGLIGGYISAHFAGTDRKAGFSARQYIYIVVLTTVIVAAVAAGKWLYRGDDLAMYYRARQYVEKERFSQADSLLEGMIERLPEKEELGIEARYLYAYSRARQGDLETAIEYAGIVVENHPDSHNAHLLLGALYLNKGEREKARTHLNEALRLNPGSEEAKRLLKDLSDD